MNANLKKSLVAGSITAMVIGLLALTILTLHSCGGGSDAGNSPVYDENGNCLNCGNGDVSVTSPDSDENGDTQPTYADGKPIPQPDTEPYVCPVSEPPEMCTVLPSGKDPNGYVPECTNSGGGNCGLPGLDIYDCICHGGYFIEQSCSTDADCQKVPPDAYPPCVCWDFCGFLGEWDCPSSVWAFSFLPDQGDGLCHFGSSGEGALGKPGDPNPRYPLDGEPEQSYVLSPDGQTLTSLTSMVTCAKL